MVLRPLPGKRIIAASVVGFAGIIAGGAVVMCSRYYRGRKRAEKEMSATRYPGFMDVGEVENLCVLPLIDWYTSGDDLIGEVGVSYLVQADETTILFDLGLNKRWEHPSPLLRNMSALGVELRDIDALVISHAHCDHIGGYRNHLLKRFSLSAEPVDVSGLKAYVPEPMSNPDADVVVVDRPMKIAPGVVTMGPIPRQLFIQGHTLEQSLAVNLKGMGIVIIIGCGHPTLMRILERAEMLFGVPIHGIIGGLHLPVTGSRENVLGIPVLRIVGTGKPPWDPPNKEDVKEAIDCLGQRRPSLVSLSPHDSCDWSVEAFREAFPEAYRDIRVGSKIEVA